MRPVKDFAEVQAPLSIIELSEHIGRSVRTIHRFLKLGMPFQRVGKRFEFDTALVREWLRVSALLEQGNEVAA